MDEEKKALDKLRRFWKRNPPVTPRTAAIWDKYWIPLSRLGKQTLLKEFQLGKYEK